MTKRRVASAMIRNPVSPYRRPIEPTPEPYDGHLTPFGANITNRAQFGGKYETKYDKNPGPGEYDIDSGMRSIKPRSPAAKMIAERADHMFIEEVP